MNRIRLLPDHVANQIAAGEVIERPASVVKELVENALDAQAAQIVVEIQAGGRSVIRVMDDGTGMSRDDALLCLERHATSKVQKAEDLASIATMGFRGEALPSIASVSRFTLTTREREGASPEGTQIVISAGKIVEVKAAGCAPGTRIEVRQLFFNLPARRKFLRTEETEAAHIQHYLTLAALAFPQAAFTFQKEGRVIWQLPSVKAGPEPAARLAALRERLRSLSGGDQKLLAVDYAERLPPSNDPESAPAGDSTLQVWGFIGAPGISRATREEQHLFVNRRPVENRGLNFALLEGYHTALMKGRYPVCCLFLEIDPAAVDVNIHPAKREVKFHQETIIRKAVTQAIRQTLLAFHGADPSLQTPNRLTVPSPTHSVSPDPSSRPAAAATAQRTSVPQPALPDFPPGSGPLISEMDAPRPSQAPLQMGFSQAVPNSVASGSAVPAGPLAQGPAGICARPAPTSPQSHDPSPSPGPARAPAHPDSLPVPLLHVPLRLLGVIGRLYLVLESDRGLVLLDQHAAHERILFEQMLTRLEQNTQAVSQRLLLPQTVELSARDADFLRQQLGVLTRLGVGLSEFGERTFLLDALPPFVKATDARRFVLGLVDELKAAGEDVNTFRLGEQTVAKTVCRHAVKANDPLTGRELENLVEDLRKCAMPYTCPHGRPTLIEMNFRELEKKFGRTQ